MTVCIAGACWCGLSGNTETAHSTARLDVRGRTLSRNAYAVHDYLLTAITPASPETIARTFVRARSLEVTAILDTLVALGLAARQEQGYRA